MLKTPLTEAKLATSLASSGSLARLRILELSANPEGQISIVECDHRSPFAVRRVYWIHSLVDGDVRGHHAHRTLQQLIVAVSGTFRIEFDDAREKREFLLDSPARALYVPPGLWRTIHCQGENAVLLVLASDHFEEADYIRDYDEFCSWARARADLPFEKS